MNGVSRQTIYDWQKAAQQPKRRRPQLGATCRLLPAQLKKLERALTKGAYEQGHADDHWTLDRIAHVIYTLFGVRYSSSGTWYLMGRLGRSSQKPQRIALQRDDGEVVRWQRHVWPKENKVA